MNIRHFCVDIRYGALASGYFCVKITTLSGTMQIIFYLIQVQNLSSYD